MLFDFISVGYLTGTFCLNFPPTASAQYQPACNKAMDAIVVQYQIDKRVNEFKKALDEYTQVKAKQYLPVDSAYDMYKKIPPAAVIAGGVVYTALVKKQFTFTTSFKPLTGAITIHADTSYSASLGLSWGF